MIHDSSLAHPQPAAYVPPRWAEAIPQRPKSRVRLAQLPTPISPWDPPDLPGDFQCWLKRDDLTGVGISGNKVRKLEFLLADALEKGCDTVLTCGGIQSNHCRSTAVAARYLGLDSCLLLRTQDPSAPLGHEGNLFLDRMSGAQLIPISYEQYSRRSELLVALSDTLELLGRKAYIIPEGGSNALGTWGYIEAIRELAVQLASEGLPLTDIAFACGSGGTAAGIALGVALSGLPLKVHAINVCDDADYFYAIIDAITQALGLSFDPREIIDIIDGYKGLGYAKNTPEELAYLRDISTRTGVILDPVYSGKAMFGLKQELHLRPERFQGKQILFLHTGGLFGLFAKASELEALFPEQNLTNWAQNR